MADATMGDAAFAVNLDGTSFDAVGGYLHSPAAYHPWSREDWAPIPGPKLPIYVATMSGLTDAENALAELQSLGVPKGKVVAYDIENRTDISLVASFGAVMQHNGYKVWTYGSAGTLFAHPQLNGYWVADYLFHPFMYSHPGVRATQWTDGPKYDQSTVKQWELANLWT